MNAFISQRSHAVSRNRNDLSLMVLCSLPWIASFVVLGSPATTYELSIYDGVPLLAWALVIGSILVAVILVVHEAVNGAKRRSYVAAALFMLVSVDIFVSLLPSLRGYYLSSRHDPTQHIGVVQNILKEGSIGARDYYPLSLVLTAIITMIHGLSPVWVARWFPCFLTVICVMNSFLLCKNILRSRATVILAVVSSTTLLFTFSGSYYAEFSPAGHLALSLMPLVLLLHLTTARGPTSVPSVIVLLILVVGFPILHPMYSLMLVSYLGLSWLPALLLRVGRSSIRLGRASFAGSVLPLLILLIVDFLWASKFENFSYEISYIGDWLYGATFGSYPICLTAEEAERAFRVFGLSPTDVLDLFMRMFGARLIFVTLSIAALCIVAHNVFRRKVSRLEDDLLRIAPGFLLNLTALIATFYLNAPSFSGTLEPFRYLHVAMVSAPLFVAFALYELLRRANTRTRRTLLSVVIVLLVTFAQANAIFSVYRSPYIHLANKQLTYAEVQGALFHFNHREKGLHTMFIDTPFYKLEQMIGGTEGYGSPEGAYFMPDHFGYLTSATLGGMYLSDRYALISRHDEVVYSTVWKGFRFSPEDFLRTDQDPTINRIYSNDELDLWRIVAYAQ